MDALGIGVVGAGGFARFLAERSQTCPTSAWWRSRQRPLAGSRPRDRGRRPCLPRWEDLLTDPDVAVVAIMTPPSSHAAIARAALEAGRHVFMREAAGHRPVRGRRRPRGRRAVRPRPGRRPRAALQPAAPGAGPADGSLLGPLQRFAFENDASDEDLGVDHWFWHEPTSGGILLEHGVHFFDAAHLLAGTLPEAVQAMSTSREDGPRTWSVPPRGTRADSSRASPTGSRTRTDANAS